MLKDDPQTRPWTRHLAVTAAVVGVATLLGACGLQTELPTAPAADTVRYDRTLLLDVTATTDREAVEAETGGDVLVWRPEAGFAVVGWNPAPGRLAPLNAESNRDAIASPVAEAEGVWNNGFHAWSGGFHAWSGGFHAWSGGFHAWSGGFHAWSGGERTETPMDNLGAWEQIGLPDAHLRLAPHLGDGVTVAVLDTGVDLDHPAFEGRLVPGWDFVDGDDRPDDEPGGSAHGHGTGVAGLVLQVAPRARIMPVRVLAADGLGDTDDVAKALDWAVAHGADVVNLSLGAVQESAVLEAMVKFAAKEGVYLVASTGNRGQEAVSYPAAHSDAAGDIGKRFLGVGSVDGEDVKSRFSNYGKGLRVMAPGESLFTAAPDGGLSYWTGTSFAAPLVSGSVALALGEPTLDPHGGEELAKLMEKAGRDIGDRPENAPFAKKIGTRLDVATLLRALELPDYGAEFRVEARDELDLDFEDPDDEVKIEFRVVSDDHPVNALHLRPDAFVLRGEGGSRAWLEPTEVKLEDDRAKVEFEAPSGMLAALLDDPRPGSRHLLLLELALGEADAQTYPVEIVVKP